MPLTVLMFVVLIVSFALMFALVKFTENVIAVPELEAPSHVDAERNDIKSAV